MSSYKNTVAVAICITVIGMAFVILLYRQISGRTGEIVVPAGNTYLGPSALDTPQPQQSTKPSVFTVSDTTQWRTIQGAIYPYFLQVPETLTLVTFPNDAYDMYAISWMDIAPDSNILIGVDDLSKHTDRSRFIKLPKTEYITQWWKQFTALKGIDSMEPFTNSAGLKGYTVRFTTASGVSPNLDVFFEIPSAPQYVIHLTNAILDPAVFAKIVDSVAWQEEQ